MTIRNKLNSPRTGLVQLTAEENFHSVQFLTTPNVFILYNFINWKLILVYTGVLRDKHDLH